MLFVVWSVAGVKKYKDYEKAKNKIYALGFFVGLKKKAALHLVENSFKTF